MGVLGYTHRYDPFLFWFRVAFHIPVMILFAALMFIMIRSRNKITKKDGVLLVSVYSAYIVSMVIFPELKSGIV